MGHGAMEIKATNKELEDFMRAEMNSKNIACDQLERTLHLAASLIEVLITVHLLSFVCINILKVTCS